MKLLQLNNVLYPKITLMTEWGASFESGVVYSVYSELMGKWIADNRPRFGSDLKRRNIFPIINYYFKTEVFTYAKAYSVHLINCHLKCTPSKNQVREGKMCCLIKGLNQQCFILSVLFGRVLHFYYQPIKTLRQKNLWFHSCWPRALSKASILPSTTFLFEEKLNC